VQLYNQLAITTTLFSELFYCYISFYVVLGSSNCASDYTLLIRRLHHNTAATYYTLLTQVRTGPLALARWAGWSAGQVGRQVNVEVYVGQTTYPVNE